MTEQPARLDTVTTANGARVSGVVIAAASVLMVGFMAMHPTAHTHELAPFVAEASRIATFNSAVHGSLMACLAALVFGFTGFAECLGLRRPLARAGLTAFALGACSLMAAATINGFIVSGLASTYSGVEGSALEPLRGLLVLCHQANAACDRIGVVALSAAVLLWSVLLVARPGVPRALGVLGLVCALLPLGAMGAGYLPMNLHGFGGFVVLQAIWYLSAASAMIGRRL